LSGDGAIMKDSRLAVPSILALAALAAALPFVLRAVGDASTITLLTRMIIYAIAAVSLNLALGYGGLLSFGHAAFYGAGGYAVGILYQHFVSGEPLFGFIAGTNQILLTLPAAVIASGLFAAAIGALSLRTSGVQFIMITLAFAQMLFFFFVALKAYGGDDGLIVRRRNELPGLDLRDETTFYFFCLGILIVVLLAMDRFVNSRFGMVLGGIRQNERRMAAIGIATYRYKLVAFVISGMGTGLAGALMANFARFASPDMLHWTKSGEFMIMVILGGVGTLLGPVFGAIALLGLESTIAGWTEHWQFVLGIVLVLLVLFVPGGLQRVFALLRRRHA
jgi:branched-chain amino acid transport system permease protein